MIGSIPQNTLDLNEIKHIESDMVKYIDDLCKENHLRYYLISGSLLGAVRHQGFIPWDDDIDIAMPRKDFEKLFEIVNGSGGHYRIQFYTNQKKYGYSFPKVLDTRTTLIDFKNGYGYEESSVFVDIFILDGLGDHPLGAKIWFKFLKIFRKMVFLSRRKLRMETPLKTIVFAMPWVICRCVGTDRINRMFHTLSAKRAYDDSRYVGSVSGIYGIKEIFPADMFGEAKRLEFEGHKLCVPAEYDKYLKQLYGDYMQLPSEEERVSNHMNKAWWNG